MTLRNFLSDYNLTRDQEALVSALDHFFEINDKIFLLRGYAGTGKTFMINGLAGYLCAAGREVILAAPTGRAARILCEKTGKQAYTIHRLLYGDLKLRDVATYAGEEYDINKIFFGLESNDHATNAVFIIDEASMVSNVFEENDLMKFGSGFLLNDFITYVFTDPASTGRKIIFSGDSAQLPPVGMPFSPALDAAYLQKNFRLSLNEYELTEVVRQDKHGTIIRNATNIREALRLNRYGLPPLEKGKDVIFINHDEVVPQFLQRAGKQYDQAVVIAYSNRIVSSVNAAIRGQIFPGNPEKPMPGDRLVVVKNNYKFSKELLNGEIGTLTEVNNALIHDHKVTVRLPLKNNPSQKTATVNLRFREAVIRFEDQNGLTDIKCMILDNVLFSHRRDLSYVESVAMLVDFKKRFAERNDRSVDFVTALKLDPFFNALRVKFGYALTGHKAQGGEWGDALVMCRTNASFNSTGYLRWLYTAITRAKTHLLMIDPPGYDETRILRAAGEQNLPALENAETITNKTDDASGFADKLLATVMDILAKLGFSIRQPEVISYGIQLLIVKGDNDAMVRIFYNSRQTITRLEIINSSGVSLEELQPLTGFTGLEDDKITLSPKAGPVGMSEVPGSENNDFIKEFSAKIENIIAPAGIKLKKTESHPYHEIFYFEKNLKYAAVKFYYNKKQQFTRYEVIAGRSGGLQTELIPLLKNMLL